MKFYKKILKPIIEQTIVYIKRPLSLFDNWAAKGRLNWMPDKWYLSFMFRSRMGYWMDWKNPKTFNEKLQWLKVYDRNPLYTKLVDKYEVRKYIAEKIGEEYLIPLLGVWDDVDDIDFEKLPNQFVLKCTHDSGSTIVCLDKTKFDIHDAKKALNNALNINYYYAGREWHYKNIKPRIIAENFISDIADSELRDYKFYTLEGTPHALLLATNRQNQLAELNFDYFDMNFSHLKMTNFWHPNNPSCPHKPKHFEEMKSLASILAKGIHQVRVDFYEANGKVYFGEMTFFDMAGFLKINPPNWDKEFGDLINLSK